MKGLHRTLSKMEFAQVHFAQNGIYLKWDLPKMKFAKSFHFKIFNHEFVQAYFVQIDFVQGDFAHRTLTY